MRLLITRPEPDAETLARQLRQEGHDVLVSPLMQIICRNDVSPPAPERLGGMVITSRNALRCLDENHDLSACHSLPLFAVGKATGHLALDMGFTNVICGDGHAAALPRFLKQHLDPQSCLPLYYPVGDKKAHDLAPALHDMGFRLLEQITYEARPASDFTPAALAALQKLEIDAVLLLSPRSARIFARLVGKNGLQDCVARISCLCLSKNVASALGDMTCGNKQIAAKPDLTSLLALSGLSSRKNRFKTSS